MEGRTDRKRDIKTTVINIIVHQPSPIILGSSNDEEVDVLLNSRAKSGAYASIVYRATVWRKLNVCHTAIILHVGVHVFPHRGGGALEGSYRVS